MWGWQFIIVLLWLGLAGGLVGRRKGGSFWLWFLVSFCVPVIGLLTAVFSRREDTELRRQCPDCGKVIKLYDTVCMRCGRELDFPDVAIMSEAAVRVKSASPDSIGSSAGGGVG